MRHYLLPSIAILIVSFIGALDISVMTGCNSLKQLTPQTQATIDKGAQDAAVQAARAKADAQVQAARAKADATAAMAKAKAHVAVKTYQGNANPAAHPFAAFSNRITTACKITGIIAVLVGLACLAEFILSFTAFDVLSPFAKGLRWTLALALLATILLPFVGWVFAALVCAVLGLFIYYLVREKGNVGRAAGDEFAEVESIDDELFGLKDIRAVASANRLPPVSSLPPAASPPAGTITFTIPPTPGNPTSITGTIGAAPAAAPSSAPVPDPKAA